MFQHLSRNFRDVEAVNDLTFDVPRGSLCALLGPNGAGKTTTIHMLMSLLRPTSGKVEVLGVDALRLGPAELSRIGYVSENQKLPLWRTVQGMLAFCKRLYPAWDGDLCTKLVKQFELPLKRKIKALSRGMRLKAAMTAALAHRPDLLVMDEPFGGLDVSVREELIEGMPGLAWIPSAELSPQMQLLSVSERVYKDLGAEPGTYSGNVTFDLFRYEILAELPLAAGRRIDMDPQPIVITGMVNQPSAGNRQSYCRSGTTWFDAPRTITKTAYSIAWSIVCGNRRWRRCPPA